MCPSGDTRSWIGWSRRSPVGAGTGAGGGSGAGAGRRQAPEVAVAVGRRWIRRSFLAGGLAGTGPFWGGAAILGKRDISPI